MEETLVFMDAGFLSKLSKYFGGGEYLRYNIINFSKNLAKKQNLVCKHIFYYTAPPFQSDDSTKEELEKYRKYETFKNKLLKYKVISIREGRCQRLKIDGKFIYNQKGVDLLVTIDLMSISFDYKDIKRLGVFITEKGKINSSRFSGNCAKHQRIIRELINKARFLSLIPYVR